MTNGSIGLLLVSVCDPVDNGRVNYIDWCRELTAAERHALAAYVYWRDCQLWVTREGLNLAGRVSH